MRKKIELWMLSRRGEDGWVVVTAVVLMAIMLGVGLAVLSSADTQSQQSRRERVRESAFNLAEGLLQAESVVLQNNWPTSAPCTGNAKGCGYSWSTTDPNSCTQATAASLPNQCPNPANVAGASGAFSNVDQSLSGNTWSIQIRDDLGVCLSNPPSGYNAFYDKCQVPIYYKGACATSLTDASVCWPSQATAKYSTDPTKAPGADQTSCKNSSNVSVACTWDANGNDELWVRVDTTVNGKTRSLVALLHLESFPVNVTAKVAVSGGAINFTNNGNKNVVDATNAPDGIVARCHPTTGATPDSGNDLHTVVTSPGITTPNSTNVLPVLAGSNYSVGQVVAVGVGSRQTPPYELLTISARTATSLTFTTNILYQHAAGEVVELSPAATNDQHPNNCESWTSPLAPGQNGADKHQFDPYQNYTSDPSFPDLMDGTTYDEVTGGMFAYSGTCPTNWNGNIYIKLAPSGGCTIPNGTFNSAAAPHILIVENQTSACGSSPALSLSGSTVFYGVIYMRNMGCTYANTVMQVAAGAQVDGGVAVDGKGQVKIGQASNSGNCTVQGGSAQNVTCPTIKFDPVSWGAIAASGAAGLVQNTWRELAPGQ